MRCSSWRKRIVALVVALVFIVGPGLAGCAKKIPHTLVPAYEKRKIRLIAVLPPVDKTNHPEISKLLRQEVVEVLYFKSYPKIAFPLIDEKIAVFYPSVKEPTPETMPPQDVGALLGVDAVLYLRLDECKTKFTLSTYARNTIAATFELYEVRTGQLLWKTTHRVTECEFNIVPEWVKMDAITTYSVAMEKLIQEVMKTLPDGIEI